MNRRLRFRKDNTDDPRVEKTILFRHPYLLLCMYLKVDKNTSVVINGLRRYQPKKDLNKTLSPSVGLCKRRRIFYSFGIKTYTKGEHLTTDARKNRYVFDC